MAVITGTAGADTLFSPDEYNEFGEVMGDDVYGLGGNDVIYGGFAPYSYVGADSLYGGAGNDIIYGSFGSGFSEYSFTLIDGGAGSDVMYGGSGDNSFFVDSPGDVVVEGGNGEDYYGDIVYATVSFVLPDNVEFLTLSGAGLTGTGNGLDNILSADAGNQTLNGKAGYDQLYGGDGNDILDGGDGDDYLDGGYGSDTASYVDATAGVTVDLGLTDWQNTLGAGFDMLVKIENLTGSAYADHLIGNALGNRLSGGGGDDVLDGGPGNDTLDGGAGSDTATYAAADVAVRVNLAITGAQTTGMGTDTLVSIENVVGSAFADTLTGNDFANILTGGAGDDVLNGGLGNDTLAGGDGIDTASYANAAGAVRVSLAIATAQSTISAGTDTLSGIENLTGGAYDDQLTGDNGNNVLVGNAGNDTLIGGLGDDTLNGGAGSDTASYVGAASGVTISLAVTTAQDTHGAGIDTLLSIENVTGSAYDDVITGSAQVNILYGGNGNDTIDAGSSNDTVDGGYGNDVLKGAAGDDILTGGVGLDTLTGGAGADTLTGGTQNDTFVYLAVGDSTLAATDRITDFAKGDILDVSAIDANTKVAGDQAFVLASAFTHTAGEFTLTYDAGTNTTTALFDTNGDAAADMAILFTGNVTTSTSTWLL
ncbi:calcium-binding protein [Flavisphingomonas formosensis]|uniref:calcium-binding protein n=1 Tax=Flavisphingomonas formosensis TaxID=861534 RepID=UPI0012F9DD15|nr:calcium-binding protein [Sphingomonas formosensis]